MKTNGLIRCPKGALIDMDGVLYDSMPCHALAWQTMMREEGLEFPQEEFFRMEGMTGSATISALFARAGREVPPEEEIRRMYARKSELFTSLGARVLMPGADRMLKALEDAGVERVLVTGSGQRSLIDSILADYPGAFLPGNMITSKDYARGKPDPEPYLKGLSLLGLAAREVVVIENAPLGVQAGHAAGCFTFGISTGHLPPDELLESGADAVFSSMPEFADALPEILRNARN